MWRQRDAVHCGNQSRFGDLIVSLNLLPEQHTGVYILRWVGFAADQSRVGLVGAAPGLRSGLVAVDACGGGAFRAHAEMKPGPSSRSGSGIPKMARFDRRDATPFGWREIGRVTLISLCRSLVRDTARGQE
jgi:hypothetical protein